MVGAMGTSSGSERMRTTSAVSIATSVPALSAMPRSLESNAVVADSTQTLLCTYLSAVLLVGLVLNATLGWGWADPIAGLVIAAVAVREGIEAWKGEGCCAPGRPSEDGGAEAGCGCPDGCADACCAPAPAAGPQTMEIGR